MGRVGPQAINSTLVLLAVSGVCIQSCRAQATALRNPVPEVQGPELGVPYTTYRLKLDSFVPMPNRAGGVLVKTRINGGPPLRLLLDTGAENITIDSRSASRSALSTVSDSFLVGAGDSPTKVARRGLAETVETGELVFRRCRVDVVRGRVVDGADGVIPLALFGGFLLRLDLPRRTLDLMPYPEGEPSSRGGFTPAVPKGDLLLARATLNEAHEGYVLLDTGASYTAISRGMARALRSWPVSTVQMRGANGDVSGDVVEAAVRFQVGGRELTPVLVVALDLTTVSAYNGIEIIGVLGYPDLSNSVLTVSYRDALVRIGPQGGDSAGTE